MEKEALDVRAQRTTLSDSVYSYLHDAIIALRIHPGQMVYEAEIADSLGVSRTPVREAFRILLSEELIEILPQRGIRIAPISQKKVEEAQFVRVNLEVSAFRVVAKRWDSSAPQFEDTEYQLNLCLARQEKAAAQDDLQGFISSDEEFHRNILRHADNVTLLNVIAGMRAHLDRLRCLELQEARHFAKIIDQHRVILAALMANKSSDAAKLVRRHIEYLQYDFRSVVQKYPTFFRE